MESSSPALGLGVVISTAGLRKIWSKSTKANKPGFQHRDSDHTRPKAGLELSMELLPPFSAVVCRVWIVDKWDWVRGETSDSTRAVP
jgi:hypothetical protein